MTSRRAASTRCLRHDTDPHRRPSAVVWLTALVVLAAVSVFTVSAALAGPELPPVCPYLKNC